MRIMASKVGLRKHRCQIRQKLMTCIDGVQCDRHLEAIEDFLQLHVDHPEPCTGTTVAKVFDISASHLRIPSAAYDCCLLNAQPLEPGEVCFNG